MTIKSSGYKEILLTLSIVGLIWFVIFQFHFWFALASCLLWYGFTLVYWLWLGKTITLSKNGCCIQFLWWKKEYLWDQFAVKCYIQRAQSFGYLLPYTTGAVFSLVPYDSKKYSPAGWFSFLHPRSFIFVCFSSTQQCPRHNLKLYEVNESVFRDQMQEWNISFQ